MTTALKRQSLRPTTVLYLQDYVHPDYRAQHTCDHDNNNNIDSAKNQKPNGALQTALNT